MNLNARLYCLIVSTNLAYCTSVFRMQLSYYDPKDDGKCLGVITIKDIQGVTESTVSPGEI